MADSALIEYLRWNVGGYVLVASGDDRDAPVDVRVSNGLAAWRVVTVTGALTNMPEAEWAPEWWPGETGADLRCEIERTVIRTVRAHYGTECDG